MTRTVFIDVDSQNDFCTSGGALSVTEIDSPEVRNIKRLARFAADENSLIIGSVDSHAYDAWEFYTNPNKGPNGEKPNFRPHCVKGEYGWLKVTGTLPDRFRFIPNVNIPRDELLNCLTPALQGVYLEKEVYSLFANPNANFILDTLVFEPMLTNTSLEQLRFIVFGVATDYCVKAAVEGLVRYCQLRKRVLHSTLNFEVALVTDAVAPVTKAGGEAALAQMKLLEAVAFVSTDDIVGPKLEPAGAKARLKEKLANRSG